MLSATVINHSMIAMMMGAVSTIEMSVNINQTTWYIIPDYSLLLTRRP
jgi:hypothetical protein